MTEMVECLLNGKYKLILPDHRAARPEWKTGWEVERIDAMMDDIAEQRAPVVLDIGAEEGDISAILAESADIVHLFEPNPKVWPNIRAIWQANNLPHPGYFVGFASSVTDLQPEHIDFDPHDAEDGWPMCAHGPLIGDHGFRHLAETAATTPQITIDDYCIREGAEPTLITMDVEGSEWEVLKGAEGVLKALRPVVYVSVHPEFMFHNFGQYERDMHNWIQALGYEPQHLAYDHEHHFRYEPR